MGNFYGVATFKFLAYHTQNCGPECIGVIKGGSVDADIFNVENEIAFLEKTKNYFPAFETKFEGRDLSDIEDIKIYGIGKRLKKQKIGISQKKISRETLTPNRA